MDEKRQWISVKERLPDNGKMLCVFAAWYDPWKRFTDTEVYTFDEIRNHRSWELEKVYTHWMELPSSPELSES